MERWDRRAFGFQTGAELEEAAGAIRSHNGCPASIGKKLIIPSNRPYRKGRSFEQARREIERYSGSQFDPNLVEVFLSIREERWRKAKLETLRNLRLPTIH